MNGSVAPRPIVNKSDEKSNAAVERVWVEVIFLPGMFIFVFVMPTAITRRN
ncbi:hypothetical protein [Kosakonia cowanii]|uniref:hypothetical protein n=1 Tax=Kosakonia cowanii TaxID=208223 RepID=UPI0039A48990